MTMIFFPLIKVHSLRNIIVVGKEKKKSGYCSRIHSPGLNNNTSSFCGIFGISLTSLNFSLLQDKIRIIKFILPLLQSVQKKLNEIKDVTMPCNL